MEKGKAKYLFKKSINQMLFFYFKIPNYHLAITPKETHPKIALKYGVSK